MYRRNGKSILATPHFVALRAIAPDEELIFDYGFNEINDNSVNSHNNSQDISSNALINTTKNSNNSTSLYQTSFINKKRNLCSCDTAPCRGFMPCNDINWLLEYHPLIEISCLVMI